jgi:hypothetical protein
MEPKEGQSSMPELSKQDGTVYAKFLGDKDFPIDWKGREAEEFWWYDDLHIPRPVSPMYFDIGGWWGPTCQYMFRRFGVPFGKDWIAKKINGYVYTMVVRRDRMRIVLKALGKKFVERGDFDQDEDIFYMTYDEVRQLFSDPDKINAKALIAERKAEREEAFKITPRDWVGTADHWSLYEQAYVGLWGYPVRFQISQSKSEESANTVRGLAASST